MERWRVMRGVLSRTPKGNPTLGGLTRARYIAKELAAAPSEPSTSPEESTTKEGSGIGGKPLTKRRAAKLVAVSASRLKGTKNPPRGGVLAEKLAAFSE